jgi:trans-aconitate 2-methyltransferase
MADVSKSEAQGEVDPGSVRAFYNEFSNSRMQDYLVAPNLRIEKAIGRILPLLTPSSRVLEVGCGLGLITERMASVAPAGVIWACDLSDNNIAQARHRCRRDNVYFRTCDVLREFDQLRSWMSESVDVAVVVDVLEHLPLGTHAAFFRNLHSVMSENATLIVTYPSPQYQRHLREKSPDELQIIDEIIELPHLLQISSDNQFLIKHFSLEDVWLTNQYIHCVLSKTLPLTPNEPADVTRAKRKIELAIAEGDAFILVDEEQWGISGTLGSRRVVPFLEKDGQYWGRPDDDATAISELERLRHEGAKYIVFAHPAFWWLDSYSGFAARLRSQYECVTANDVILIFRL